MPIFHFKGRNQQGNLVEGERESNSADTLASQLFGEGIIPINIAPSKKSSLASESLEDKLGLNKVKNEDLILFCNQMYSLYKAGIPITTAITRIAETTTNTRFAKTLKGITQHLSSGQSLGKAMQRYPTVFPNLVVRLIEVGEESAQLDEAFKQIADYLYLQESTVKQVKTVLRYPMTVLVAISAAIIIINLFVIPSFAKLYESFHATLPLPTRILIGTSTFMVHYWFLLLLIFIGAIFMLRSYLNTKAGAYAWSHLQLRLPIVGDILLNVILARFSRTLAIIIKSGIPISDGLTLVANAVNNAYAQQCIVSIKDAIEHGSTLTSAAANTKLFSPLVLQMLAVGEETGSIDSLLMQVSTFYEEKISYSVKTLSAKIEPILLIAIAGMVLVLALGVFLPMWSMAKFAQGGG